MRDVNNGYCLWRETFLSMALFWLVQCSEGEAVYCASQDVAFFVVAVVAIHVAGKAQGTSRLGTRLQAPTPEIRSRSAWR